MTNPQKNPYVQQIPKTSDSTHLTNIQTINSQKTILS